MRRTLRFAGVAADDLAGIREFIRRENPQAAQRMMARFRELFRLLIKNPGMGAIRDDVPQRDVRSVSMGNYVVYFRQHADLVELPRVVHGAQDTPSLD